MAADFQQLELFTYANAIAFCVLFALVPFALFVVALLGFLDLTVLWTRDLAPGVGAIVGPSAFGVLDETVRQILVARQGYWLTAGLALTVWELSNAVFAVGGALNRIYRLSDERPLWHQFRRSIVLGVVVGICLLGTLAVTQVVPGLAERTLAPGTFAGVLGFIARWVVAVAAMLLVVGMLIRYAPAEPVKWRCRDPRDRGRLEPHVDRLRCLHQRLGQLRLALRRSRLSVHPPSVPLRGCPRPSLRGLRRAAPAYGRRAVRALRGRGR